MSIIRTEQLSRTYGRRIGIEKADLNIGPGETFGFLGPNGAGKTTTIRLLLGFLRPTHGRASIFGRDCWNDSPRIKRDVGYLPGDVRLYPWLTGRRALRIVGRVRGVNLAARGMELAELFQLEMNLRVQRMSRGTRQKLALILAMAHNPRLMILDEPTSGLDPLMQQELAQCLRSAAAQGSTVFFSSHTLSEVESLCDRVAIVRKGRIVADETIASLRSRAPRTVELIFQDQAVAERTEPPHGVRTFLRHGSTWHCELDGPARPLIQWAAGQAITDISITPPDLENVFRKYYEEPTEA